MKGIEGAMNVVTIKKKQQKAEDFIGWKSKDNNLEVTGIVGRYDGGNATFKVTCKICSQDPELFPLGYFISTRQALEDGGKPCGVLTVLDGRTGKSYCGSKDLLVLDSLLMVLLKSSMDTTLS